MYNEIKSTFSAKIENVMLARTIGIAFLVELDLTLNFVNEVKTVISEAITNAIVHGCLSNENKVVQLNMSYDDVNIYIEVIDKGVGIADIEKAREPLFSTKVDEERAGLGFTIMEVFTDKLEVRSRVGDGTKVIMVKKYHGENN
ncbi:MAG: anti-sigma F factor [Anaeroplasma bactoclasticum]|nr:anti-sigma F factor [Staphylococcus sp.]MCM1349819.1 anti-sigma F factor [Prevotella sp.]MCM1514376.1 anti-sigma F factor [Anaeroplasma bactoclasticum]